MPRVRGSEMAPKVSTRGPAHLRTSSSDSDPSHPRPVTDRSPRLGDRRSPRSTNSDPLNQKKLGTRIAGLENQLEQAQGELKILKDQLASAEAAKKEAQKELEKRTGKPAGSDPVQETRESPDETQKETDVFEVPIEMVKPVSNPISQNCDEKDVQVKVKVNIESPEEPGYGEATDTIATIAAKEEELSELKAKIVENDKKLEEFNKDNECLRVQLTEATVKEEKMKLKLTEIEEELKKSKKEETLLKERVKEIEGGKEALEIEMKRLRVQTEQWRKAADAAAAIIEGGVERCGSMEKSYGDVLDGFVGSPGFGDEGDDGKRKGSGIRMFGDLWKKKGQK